MNTVLFVNPRSCGGKGIEKWEKVKPFIGNNSSICISGEYKSSQIIKDYYDKGIRHFIAAGGDGTVNFLLNELINSLPGKQLSNTALGAIGIGSSNDFHKPFYEYLYDGIPAMINFDKAELRDVGCVSYIKDGREERKYFLINASIGITADANYLFNNPDKILSYLKNKSTPLSIMYSALKTIFTYKNFPALITSGDYLKFETDITNLGIIKNPCFSGNLRYNFSADYSNGYFNVFLFDKMSLRETIQLLRYLGNGKSDLIKKQKHWKTPELSISSEKNFFVEYDGEIIKTDNVKFSILPKLIKVCTC